MIMFQGNGVTSYTGTVIYFWYKAQIGVSRSMIEASAYTSICDSKVTASAQFYGEFLTSHYFPREIRFRWELDENKPELVATDFKRSLDSYELHTLEQVICCRLSQQPTGY